MILKIKRHYKIDYFNEYSVTLKHDSVASKFSFSTYYNEWDFDQMEMLQVGHYHECSLEHNGELLVSGYILNHGFLHSPVKNLATISGYSTAGALIDSCIPPEAYPLQNNGLTILQIARKICAPFKHFKVVVDPEVAAAANKVIAVSTAGVTEKCASYLANVASQHDIVLSNTPEGNLLLTKAKTKQKPSFVFDESSMPNISMALNFNGQSMHSHITVKKQASVGSKNATSYTIRNPFVPYVYRPLVISQSSGDDGNVGEIARNALRKELKNITLTIEVSKWDIESTTIKPNIIISAYAPELYLYKMTKWFVEEVTYRLNEGSNTALLKCVLPEVYNNDTPDYIFNSEVNKGHKTGFTYE